MFVVCGNDKTFVNGLRTDAETYTIQIDTRLWMELPVHWTLVTTHDVCYRTAMSLGAAGINVVLAPTWGRWYIPEWCRRRTRYMRASTRRWPWRSWLRACPGWNGPMKHAHQNTRRWLQLIIKVRVDPSSVLLIAPTRAHTHKWNAYDVSNRKK